MGLFIEPEEIQKTISILKPNNELYECRIIKGFTVLSGYFRGADKLIAELGKVDLRGANVYFTLQRLHEGCEARVQWEHFVESGRAKVPTTSDKDIVAYEYIPVDLDPIRPAGISSSEGEKAAAEEMRELIIAYMTAEKGFRRYISASSGNGYHVLFPVDLKNNEESRGKVQRILSDLDSMFSNDLCEVDAGNYNPGRIFKLYGTLAQKGRSTPERPFRMSRIEEEWGTLSDERD